MLKLLSPAAPPPKNIVELPEEVPTYTLPSKRDVPLTFNLYVVVSVEPIDTFPLLPIINLSVGVPETLDDILKAPVLALLVIIQSVEISVVSPLISSIEGSLVVVVCNLNLAFVALYI